MEVFDKEQHGGVSDSWSKWFTTVTDVGPGPFTFAGSTYGRKVGSWHKLGENANVGSALLPSCILCSSSIVPVALTILAHLALTILAFRKL